MKYGRSKVFSEAEFIERFGAKSLEEAEKKAQDAVNNFIRGRTRQGAIMTVEEVKLALIDKTFTDAEAEFIFNKALIESEEELLELLGCLEKHRKALYLKFAMQPKGGRS